MSDINHQEIERIKNTIQSEENIVELRKATEELKRVFGDPKLSTFHQETVDALEQGIKILERWKDYPDKYKSFLQDFRKIAQGIADSLKMQGNSSKLERMMLVLDVKKMIYLDQDNSWYGFSPWRALGWKVTSTGASINRQTESLIRQLQSEGLEIIQGFSPEKGNFIIKISEFEEQIRTLPVIDLNGEALLNYAKYLKENGKFTSEYLQSTFSQEKITELSGILLQKNNRKNRQEEINEYKKLFLSMLTKINQQLSGDINLGVENFKFINQDLKNRIGLISNEEVLLELFKYPEAQSQLQSISLTQLHPRLRENINVLRNIPFRLMHDDISGLGEYCFLMGSDGMTQIANYEVIKILIKKSAYGEFSTIFEKIYQFTRGDDQKGRYIIKKIIQDPEFKQFDPASKIPLYILKGDVNNDLGIDIESKKGRLENVINITDIEGQIHLLKEIAAGNVEDIVVGIEGPEKSKKQLILETINTYIEANGIEGIEGYIEILAKEKHLTSLPAILPFLWKDKKLAVTILTQNVSDIRFIPKESITEPAIFSGFLEGLKNESDYTTARKAIDYIAFGNVQQVVEFYKVVQEKFKNNFIEITTNDLIQYKISLALKNAGNINLDNNEDFKILLKINTLIGEFLKRKNEIQGINATLKQVQQTEKIENDYRTKIKNKIKEYFPSKSDRDIEMYESIFNDPKWFEKKINTVIALFGGDTKKLDAFIKEIKSIETEKESQVMEIKRVSLIKNTAPEGKLKPLYTLNELKGIYEIDTGKIQQNYYDFIRTGNITRGETESFEDFHNRVLEEYLKTLGNDITPQEGEAIKTIIVSLQRIERNTFIIQNTAQSIENAKKGNFENYYASYIQKTHNISPNTLKVNPENIIASPEEKIVHIGSESYIQSGEVMLNITPEEEIYLQTPEARKNFIHFYNTLNSLGLGKIWNIRDKIFGSIEHQGGNDALGFDLNAKDYIGEKDLKIFLAKIINISQIKGTDGEIMKIEPGKVTFQQIRRLVIEDIRNMTTRNNKGETKIEEAFRVHYFKDGIVGHTVREGASSL